MTFEIIFKSSLLNSCFLNLLSPEIICVKIWRKINFCNEKSSNNTAISTLGSINLWLFPFFSCVCTNSRHFAGHRHRLTLKKTFFLLPIAQYEINPNSTEVHVILFYLRVGGQGVMGVDQRNCPNPYKEWNPDLHIYAPMLYHWATEN